MGEREAARVRQVRRILTQAAEGTIDAETTRKLLAGLPMPNEYARYVKEGRWANEGGFPTGSAGLIRAARAALSSLPEGKEAK